MHWRFLAILGLATCLLAGCQSPTEPVASRPGDPAGDPAGEPDPSTERHPLEEFEERNDDPLAAAAERYFRRLSADGTVPDRALLNAKDQRDSMLQARQMNSGPTGIWPSSWDWMGPGNIGGRLRPIVIDPTNPEIMYVGSASGGIWKTTTAGAAWFPLDDFLPSLCVSDLVMHPDLTNVLFAATGEGFFETVEGTSNTAAVRGAGIFFSLDSGATWDQLPSTDNPDFYFVNRLAFDPTDADTMLAATTTGIWRTTDAGVSWNLQQMMHALDVKFDPNNPLQVMAGGHHTHMGPMYSNDGGITWQQSSGAGGHRQEIGWAPDTPNLVYAAVSDDPGRIKIWESTDGGQTFALKTSGNGIQTWASYNNTVWVDPTDSDTIILGGVYLYRSTDGGVSFNRRFNAVHADMHRIVPHPNFNGGSNRTVYFATDGGIWQTNDVYASSAFDLNNNLGVTQFYGGGINPATGHIIGGTQDNGTLFFNGDPQNWDHIFGGDGGYGAADPTDPDYFYGEIQWAYLHRSSNGGDSSSYIYGGPNPIGDVGSSSTTNFIPFFTLDPNEPNRMLVACERMWRSNNVKASQPDWFSIKDSIAPPSPPPRMSPGGRRGGKKPGKPKDAHFAENPPYHISTISVALGDSDRIWAGHNNGSLYYTTDGTSAAPTWTRVDENGAGLPDRWISTVVIDPSDHNHVYVAFMGWESGNIWETSDGGATWTDVTGVGVGTIPDAPVSALALHRTQPGWLFAGTDVGVFASSDNGASWSPQVAGPGNVPIEQLLWKDDHSMLVVTHGRGMYVASENSVPIMGTKLLDGVAAGGSVADMETSDNQYYRLDPNPTSNPVKQKVEMVVQSTSTGPAPSTFQFRLQSRMNGGPSGDVIQTIRLYDYDLNDWEYVDIRAVATSDETVLFEPTGDPGRFVQTGTNEITGLVTWQSESFSGSPFSWSIEIDQCVWLINN